LGAPKQKVVKFDLIIEVMVCSGSGAAGISIIVAKLKLYFSLMALLVNHVMRGRKREYLPMLRNGLLHWYELLTESDRLNRKP